MVATFAQGRTIVGIAKEATKGTPVAPTAFIPVRKFEGAPKQIKLADEGWRGSMASLYGLQNGPRSAEVSMEGDVFADTIGYMLNGVMGDVVTTGASSPFSHKIALLNSGAGQPVSYTVTDSQMGIQARAYAGLQFTELTLKWDVSGLMTWEAKGLSWIGATASQPTATYGTLTPIANWIGALKFNAVAVPNVQQAEITFKRDGAEVAFGLGAQDPYVIQVGDLDVAGKFTFVAADETPYTAYAAGTNIGPVTVGFSQGANAQANFTMTNVQYDDAKVVRGKSYAEIETSWRCIANSTDVGASAGFGPATVTVINSLPSGTFG